MSAAVRLPACHAAAADGTATQRPPNIGVLKSSCSRPNKNQSGWGNAPPTVLHKVLSHALEDVELDRGLRLARSAVSIALAVARRLVLTNLRLVSDGWRASIDNHEFWTDFQATLRPDLAGGSDVHLIAARAATIGVCVACKFQGNPGSANVTAYVPTAKLNLLPTCRPHCTGFCSNCLRVSHGTGEPLWLRPTLIGDVDEFGHERKYAGPLCSECRRAAFTSALQRDLVECARGGPVLGLGIDWTQTPAYRDHVYFGAGRSDMMARQAVEDMFLHIHTQLGDPHFMSRVHQLQHQLRHIKVLTWERRNVTARDLANLQDLVFLVFGNSGQGLNINVLYRAWQREMDTGGYDDVDYRLDIERLRFGMSGASLWSYVRERVVERVVSQWARDRFFGALWVMPSDEIEQIANPSTELHSSLLSMAQGCVRPSDSCVGQLHVFNNYWGRFQFGNVNSPHNGQMFLPPDRLLQVMNVRFTDQASVELETTLAEFVTHMRSLPPKEYDRIEEECANMTLKDIMCKLHDPTYWLETGVHSEGERTAPASPPGGGMLSSSDDEIRDVSEPGKTFEEGDVDELPETQAEPRIEIVQYNVNHPQFEIREGWSSTGEEDGDEDDDEDERSTSESSPPPSPKLGKRKSEDDDPASVDEDRLTRPRLGSGETSQSGDSTNTALVTPDDSPSLLGEETIKVADVDVTAVADAESISIEEVPASPGTTRSPKLGKRKSPDDDDLAQPNRRRSSAGVSEASEDGCVAAGERTEDRPNTGASAGAQETDTSEKPQAALDALLALAQQRRLQLEAFREHFGMMEYS